MNKRLLALSCFVALSLAAVLAQEPTTAVPGATNFHRFDNNFASGGVTTPEQLTALRKLGFRTIVSLQMTSEPGVDLENEAKAVANAGMKFVSLPFSTTTPDLTVVTRFLDLVRDPANQPLYLHCYTGQRANAFAIIKRVLVDGWTTEKAVAEADSLKMNERLRDFAVAYLKDQQK